MSLSKSTIIVLLLSTTSIIANAVEIGDEVCMVGYIMDNFCIERGTLLDPGGGIVSLEEPERHTFHCLFDVGICIDSGYAVLGPKDDETGLHSIGYRIEDTDAVVEAGRALGKEGSYPLCDTCTNNDDDGPLDNYKATVKGVVSELGDGTEGEPTGAPLISNVQMLDGSVGCPEPTPAPQSDEPTSKPITSQPTISVPATDAPVMTAQPTVMSTDEPTQPPVTKQTDSPIEDVTTTEATVITEEETTTATTDATSIADIEEEEEEMKEEATMNATVITEEETTTTTTDATSRSDIEEEEMKEEATMNDPTPAPTEWWQKDGGTNSSNPDNSSAKVLCSSFSLLLGALAVMYFHL